MFPFFSHSMLFAVSVVERFRRSRTAVVLLCNCTRHSTGRTGQKADRLPLSPPLAFARHFPSRITHNCISFHGFFARYYMYTFRHREIHKNNMRPKVAAMRNSCSKIVLFGATSNDFLSFLFLPL